MSEIMITVSGIVFISIVIAAWARWYGPRYGKEKNSRITGMKTDPGT